MLFNNSSFGEKTKALTNSLYNAFGSKRGVQPESIKYLLAEDGAYLLSEDGIRFITEESQT